LREAILILRFDCFLELADGCLHDFVDQLRNWKIRIFVCWMKLCRVIEAFIEFVEFVTGQLPVRVLSGKPHLRVPHLRQRHDFAKTWRVPGLGGFTIATRTSEEQSATADDCDLPQHNLLLTTYTFVINSSQHLLLVAPLPHSSYFR